MKAVWYRYRIDLGRAVRLGPAESRTRHGFLLRLVDEDGREAVGEAAPIDGYGRDTVADVRASLAAAATALRDTSVPSGVDALSDWSGRYASDWPPTVRFAAESALMALSAEAAGVSPGMWLGGVQRPLIGVCGLQTPGSGIGPAHGTPTSVVKIKIGGGDPAVEGREAAARLAAAPGMHIRCDANRAFSASDARAFVDSFVDSGGDVDRIEFLEEPLASVDELASFAAECPFPIALDETVLHSGSEFDPEAWPAVQHFVLKPSLLGGVTDALRLVQRIQDAGKKIVVSSAFESGVGLLAAAWVASTFEGPAAGFGTAGHVASAEIPVARALLEHPIAVANLPGNQARDIRFDMLEEIR